MISAVTSLEPLMAIPPFSLPIRDRWRLVVRVAQLVHPFQHVDRRHSCDACTVRGPVLVSLVTPTVLFQRHLCCFDLAPAPGVGALRRVMVGESLLLPDHGGALIYLVVVTPRSGASARANPTRIDGEVLNGDGRLC